MVRVRMLRNEPRYMRLAEGAGRGSSLCACSEDCAWIVSRTGVWTPFAGWSPPWCVHCFVCGRLLRDPRASRQVCWWHQETPCPTWASFERTFVGSRWCGEFLRRSGGVPPPAAAWDAAARQHAAITAERRRYHGKG